MKTRWMMIAASAGLASLLLLASAFLRRPDAGVTLHALQRGDLRVWTVYDGTLQSRSVRGVSSQLGGGATVTDLIGEGTQVSAGTPLVRLDATGLERDLVRLKRELALARAEYDSLTLARIPLEKRELEMRLLQARSELQDAEDALRDLKELVDEGLIPSQDAVQQEKKNMLLRSAVENLEQQLALTTDFLHPAATERAQAQRDAAEREWAMAQRQLEQSVITAPSDGIVVYQPVAVGSEFRTIRVGDTVYKNQVFLTLPDMTNLIVQVDVPEYELTLAAVGRPVTVQPVAYPGMLLPGVIDSVGSMAITRPDRPGRQKYFQVVIRLEEVRPELRSGMSCRVQVLSHDVQNALLIPRAAVEWDDQAAYCRVLRDSGIQRERIRLGVAGPQEIAVLEGLEAGQRVVLP